MKYAGIDFAEPVGILLASMWMGRMNVPAFKFEWPPPPKSEPCMCMVHFANRFHYSGILVIFLNIIINIIRLVDLKVSALVCKISQSLFNNIIHSTFVDAPINIVPFKSVVAQLLVRQNTFIFPE